MGGHTHPQQRGECVGKIRRAWEQGYTPDEIEGSPSGVRDREWGSCGTRRRARLLAILTRRSTVFSGERRGRRGVQRRKKGGDEVRKSSQPRRQIFGCLIVRYERKMARKDHTFRTIWIPSTRTKLAECPCRHNRRLAISPDTPRSSPYPFP